MQYQQGDVHNRLCYVSRMMATIDYNMYLNRCKRLYVKSCKLTVIIIMLANQWLVWRIICNQIGGYCRLCFGYYRL